MVRSRTNMQKMKIFIYLLVFGIFTGSGSPCSATSTLSSDKIYNHPIKTTACEILRRPEIYSGKLVSVTGIIYTDYREFTSIIDENCKGRVLKFGTSTHAAINELEMERALE